MSVPSPYPPPVLKSAMSLLKSALFVEAVILGARPSLMGPPKVVEMVVILQSSSLQTPERTP